MTASAFVLQDNLPIPNGSGRIDRLPLLKIIQQKVRGGVFAEIGTYKGGFALELMESCQPARISCIDPYESYEGFKDAGNFDDLDEIFAEAQRRLAPYGDRVEFIRQYSEAGAAQFADASLDFVYIDGNHSYPYVMKDLEAWFPKVKAGGLVCGDDASDRVSFDARNEDGDVMIVWEKDAAGEPVSWGYYGVLKAVYDFVTPRGLDAQISGSQFIIQK